MAEDVPIFDAVRLIALVRAGDETALRQAYRMTFDNDLGRLVLAHHLVECGVGKPFDAAGTAGQLRYQTGVHDGALLLAAKAGFDQASIAVAVLSDQLEESDHEEFAFTPLGHDADELLDG